MKKLVSPCLRGSPHFEIDLYRKKYRKTFLYLEKETERHRLTHCTMLQTKKRPPGQGGPSLIQPLERLKV